MKRHRETRALSKSAVPRFDWLWLMPRYWLTWLLVLLLTLYQLMPLSVRQKLSRILGKKLYQRNKKRRNIALTNLRLCFPEWDETRREELVLKHFIANVHVMLDLPLLWWSNAKKLKQRIKLEGLEQVDQIIARNENIVLLTCHSVALEYGAIGLNFRMPIVGLVNPFRNPLVDWLISRARTRFNIKLAVRSDGIRSIIKAIKKGEVFYYLPDEDALDQRTVEAPFFAHPKQSLPTLGRLAKLGKAHIVPCYSWYDFESRCYRVRCLAELELSDADDELLSTQQMNQKLEELIAICPHQYMWTMRLFESYSAYV